MGQILELKASHIAVSNEVMITDEEYMRNYGMEHTQNTGVVKLYIKGSPVLRLNHNGEVEHIEADWGYGRVLLLHHLTLDKHHYTRTKSKVSTKYAASGRAKGGSVKFGEMEMQALASKHTLLLEMNERKCCNLLGPR